MVQCSKLLKVTSLKINNYWYSSSIGNLYFMLWYFIYCHLNLTFSTPLMFYVNWHLKSTFSFLTFSRPSRIWYSKLRLTFQNTCTSSSLWAGEMDVCNSAREENMEDELTWKDTSMSPWFVSTWSLSPTQWTDDQRPIAILFLIFWVQLKGHSVAQLADITYYT